MWMDLAEASAKIRDDINHDEPGDESWPTWAGVIPLGVAAGEPQPDQYVADGTPVPDVAVPAIDPGG